MKNYLILAMILFAGATAYPQATRSSRETKSEKGSAKKESTQRSATRTETKSNRSANVERSKSTTSRPEATRSRVETRSNEQVNRPRVETRSNNQITRQRVETRSNDQNRVSQDQNRRSQEQTRVRTNTQQATRSGNSAGRQQNSITRPENRSGSGAASSRNIRESGNSDGRDIKVNSSSASRVYREGKGTLTREDGSVVRHQNDEVFASRKYKLDYDNYENLRRSDDFRRGYREYDYWYNRRYVRVINHYNNHYISVPWEVRRSRYYHRQPFHVDLIWTPLLFHRFMYYYPTQRDWNMEFGSQIETISANEAEGYPGSVKRIYGKVDEVYYSPEDETYTLYIGAPFPYQDISIVIPKNIARSLSMSPKWYFENEYIWVVGLINMWEGKPEIVVRDEDQIRKY